MRFSRWPAGDGEMAARIGAHPWAETPLGPVERWPPCLRTAVDMVLAMPGPATILWGPQHVQLYNDAYVAIAKERHPGLLGRPAAEGWPEVHAEVLGPVMEAAFAGRATRLADLSVQLQGPDGRPEDRAFDTTWSPIRDEAGAVGGALEVLVEVTDRRRAQGALREGEARHRLLIESWAQAVWETDADGVVVADSPSWRAYTGQTLEEWLGYGWLDAIHPDDRADAERQWREATAARGLVDAEFRLRAPDGGWRWTNVRAAPVLDRAGRIEKWAGLNIDIDARKRAEAALRESEERYRSLFNVVSQGLAINQLVRDGNGRVIDTRFLDLNPAYEEQTGFERGRAVGRLSSEIFPSVGPFWLEMAERVVGTGQAERIERFVADTGRWFAFDMAPFGGTDRFVVLYDNITDRKEAEERLRESEERFRTLAETIDDVFYVTDLDRTALEYLSPSYERVWGRPAAELLADVSRFTETVHEDDRAVRDSGMKAQRRLKPVMVEYRIRRPDGSIRHILDRTFPVPGSGGRRMAGVATDITDRKQAEERLRESEERQAFLLKLSDALRPLADAGEIQATTARLLGAHLGVDRAMYAEVTGEPGAETGVIRGPFIRPAAPGRPAPAPFPDRFTYESFGANVMARRYSGEGLAVADVNADAEFDATERAAWARVGVRAAIVAPLVKSGRLVAELGVHSETSRAWTDAEISLVREVGERTWAAVERACAEAALLESEGRYRTLFETMDEGFVVGELVRDENGKGTDFRYLELNPAVERLVGWNAKETVGRLMSEMIPPAETAYWVEGFEAIIAAGASSEFEHFHESLGQWYRANATPVGGDRVALVYQNVTAQKRAELSLRESEARQAFLLAFSDALRAEPTADAVANRAIRMLSEQMRLDRCYLADYRLEDDRADITHQAGNDSVPPMPETIRLSDFPEAFRVVFDRTLVIEDVLGEQGLSQADRRNILSLGMGALLAPTLRKGAHRPLWVVVAVSARPRRWTPGEIALVEDVAERTWAAIERARAEAALRESEERNAFLVRFSDAVRGLSDPSLVAKEACRILTEQLGTDRTLWAVLDWEKREYVADWALSADGAPVEPSRWPFDEREPFAREHLAGRPVVYDDVALDPRLPDPVKAAMTERGLLAGIAVPVVVAGRLLAVLNTSQRAAPRRWLPHEVAFVEALAQRAWGEIERARAEAGLREREGRLRDILGSMNEGFALFDRDFTILDVNRETLRLDGRSREDLIGRSHWDAFPGTEHSPLGELYRRVMRDRTPGSLEHRYHWPDGRDMWVDARAYPTHDGGVAVFWRDITDRKRAETALREREAELARVQRIGRIGGMEVGLTDGFRNRRSPEYLRLHGLPPEAVHEPHEAWVSRLHPEDRAAAEKRLGDALSSGATEYESEYRIVRPSDGAVRWIAARGEIERDGNGRAVRLVGAHMDVTERKEGEARLRESERSFRTLADTVPQLVWMGEEPSASYYNRRWYEYTGLTEAESLNTTAWHAVVHPDDRALALERSERSARTGEVYEIEYRLRRADGAYRWHIARAVRLDGTRSWIGAATDIDDLRRARDALAESEERFRSFADNSADTLWILDAGTRRLEYLSPAFEAMWGESRDAVMRDLDRWAALLHPEDRERASQGMPRLLAGDTYQQTYRVVRPSDGAVRWIQDTGFPIRDGDGRVQRVAGIAQDVTDARNAAHAVRRSERRLRALVEGIPQLVWRAVDGGEWTWSSPQWSEFTGLSVEDSLGRGWLQALHPDDRERAMEAWRAAEEAGALAVEYRLRHAAENRYRWFSTRATAVRDEDGRVVEWLGTSTDIDDLRRLQEHGKLLVAELQHRVRNTLGVIRSVARRTADTSDTVEDYAMHLDGRINAFARVQAAVTRNPASGIDLERLVADELRAHGAQEGDRVRSIKGPKVLLKPKAAETLALAVHELATNAVKYGALSTGKGRIAVAWRFEEADGRRRLLFHWTESGVKLAGGKPQRRGFGTELIERTLAYDLGGEANLDFKPDGLTCTISLPADDGLIAEAPGRS